MSVPTGRWQQSRWAPSSGRPQCPRRCHHPLRPPPLKRRRSAQARLRCSAARICAITAQRSCKTREYVASMPMWRPRSVCDCESASHRPGDSRAAAEYSVLRTSLQRRKTRRGTHLARGGAPQMSVRSCRCARACMCACVCTCARVHVCICMCVRVSRGDAGSRVAAHTRRQGSKAASPERWRRGRPSLRAWRRPATARAPAASSRGRRRRGRAHEPP